jgi:hypothetical protein
MSENGLDCSETVRMKFIIFAWTVFMIWQMYSWFHVLLCVIPFTTWTIIGGLYMSPDLTVFADGIETSRFGIKQFIEWKDINYIEHHNLGFKIGHRKTPLAMKIFILFNPPIQLNRWRHNYKEAIAIIEENTETTGSSA